MLCGGTVPIKAAASLFFNGVTFFVVTHPLVDLINGLNIRDFVPTNAGDKRRIIAGQNAEVCGQHSMPHQKRFDISQEFLLAAHVRHIAECNGLRNGNF